MGPEIELVHRPYTKTDPSHSPTRFNPLIKPNAGKHQASGTYGNNIVLRWSREWSSTRDKTELKEGRNGAQQWRERRTATGAGTYKVKKRDVSGHLRVKIDKVANGNRAKQDSNKQVYKITYRELEQVTREASFIHAGDLKGRGLRKRPFAWVAGGAPELAHHHGGTVGQIGALAGHRGHAPKVVAQGVHSAPAPCGPGAHPG